MKRLIAASSVLLALSVALPVSAADTTRPVVGAPGPETATAGAAVTITASATDAESGVASCNLYVEFQNVASMQVANGVASVSYVFTQPGVYTIFVFCRDAAGNFDSGPNSSILVNAPSGGGFTPPPPTEIGLISPTSTTAGIPAFLQATVTGDVRSCVLVVESIRQEAMTLSGSVASASHTFANPGNYSVHAQCVDSQGTVSTGEDAVVTVTAEPPPPPIPGSRLVKLTCPTDAPSHHSCRSVYYQGTDGKRHAFTSDKSYFTWYSDFSGVQAVDAASMAAVPLGANVTFRPGAKLVKFETVNRVYAVSRGGVLRWVTSEALASALYGADWSAGISDISDTLFGDYTLGADIENAADYSRTDEMAGTPTIDADL